MICKGCGKGTRHSDVVHKHVSDENNGGTSNSQNIEDYIKGNNVGPKKLYDDMNNATFEELEIVRKDGDKAIFDVFVDSFKLISDSFKASQVLNMVDIINGRRFSPEGLTPQYCILLLHSLLVLDESESVNQKFPSLKLKIKEKYYNLKKNWIIL